MRKLWQIVKFTFWVLLALAMIVCLIMSFFDPPPDAPEFVWGPRVY